MIIVTGGAGFIGSAVIWKLNELGYDNILVVDKMDNTEKWRNLVPLKFTNIISPEDFLIDLKDGRFLGENGSIIHMGACTSTVDKDLDYMFTTNYEYTKVLMAYCDKYLQWRMIYASSAATYGNPKNGVFDDNIYNLSLLRPVSPYAYSKHLIDLENLRMNRFNRVVGLKFFNVFGPNEYHKGEMSSKIFRAYNDMINGYFVPLYMPPSTDFQFKLERDFIYIKDVADIVAFFVLNKKENGLFNVGSGISQSWDNIVNYVAKFTLPQDTEPSITRENIPEDLQYQYQYYTCSNNDKLFKATKTIIKFTPIKYAIEDYIKNYLQGRQIPKVLGE